MHGLGESKTSNTAATSAISIITESNKIITIDVSVYVWLMSIHCTHRLLEQDLLPLLPDQTDIEILKDEICQSLEACGSRIEGLNQAYIHTYIHTLLHVVLHSVRTITTFKFKCITGHGNIG